MKKSVETGTSVDLKPILDALAKRVGKAGLAEAQAFAAAFYRRMDADEIASRDAAGWAELAADMLEFARTRKRGKANVRLSNPADSTHTLVQIVNDDMPFLVDSVTMALADAGIGVHVLGHPVIRMNRDKGGKLVGVGEGAAESLMHLEIDRQPQAAMAAVKARIVQVLDDVRAIVTDWEPMRDRMLRGRRRAGHPQAAGGRCRPPGGAGVPALGRRQPFHLLRLPRIRGRQAGQGRHPVRGAGQRPGPAARRGERRASAEVAGGACAAAVRRGRCADPDQDQCARHRAPPRLHGLHRRAELRREGPRGQRAAFRRPVHLQRLQRAVRGTSRWCASATTT